MWSRLFAFWKDYEDRKEQIRDGLGKYVEACVEAAVPVLIVLAAGAVTAIKVGPPRHPLPWIVLAGAAIGYVYWWFPYCVGKARNQLPKILGREPTEALGDAHFATHEDLAKLGYDGSRGGIYVGMTRDE